MAVFDGLMVVSEVFVVIVDQQIIKETVGKPVDVVDLHLLIVFEVA